MSGKLATMHALLDQLALDVESVDVGEVTISFGGDKVVIGITRKLPASRFARVARQIPDDGRLTRGISET